jgi:tyrosyl-tRNA synthetase
VMEAYGLDPQVVITYPLLIGLDGVEKMSKSKGNYIAVTDPPEEMFGKVMSIGDELLEQWWSICLGAEAPKTDPMTSKLALARGIVEKWHGAAAAAAAEEHFTRVVRRHEAPEEVPEAALPEGDPIHLPALLVERGLSPSTSEARRLIAQGGVKVDGAPVTDLDVPRNRLEGAVVQAGKRRFMRFRAA